MAAHIFTYFAVLLFPIFVIIKKNMQIWNNVARHTSDMSRHQRAADGLLHFCSTCPELVNVAAVVWTAAQISGQYLNHDEISFRYPPASGKLRCHKILYELYTNPCRILKLEELSDITICCVLKSRNIAGGHSESLSWWAVLSVKLRSNRVQNAMWTTDIN
jgi:hypothetical protein